MSERASKVCAICRKDIDGAALRCPFCLSDADYRYFAEFPNSQVLRERRPVRSFMSYAIALIATMCIFYVAFGLGGFWVGIVATGLAGAASLSIIRKAIGIKDNTRITCQCGHEDIYEWEDGLLEVGKQAQFNCSDCKQRTRITITAD